MIEFLKKIKHKTRVRTRLRAVPAKTRDVAYIYRNNGIRGVALHVRGATKKRIPKKQKANQAGDVLFISIDEPLLDRYRTDHMIESLESTGMSVGKVFYYDLRLEHIKRYNVFVFYRCPWLPGFEKVFEEIKRKNKVSVYAIDDLVIDTKYTDSLPVLQAMIPKDRELYDDGVRRHNELMRRCDYAITTTEGMFNELNKYKNFKKIYIDRNSMSDEMVYWSDQAIRTVKREENKVIIGYFSGTNTHNEDFQMIAPALTRILDKYDDTYIKLAGRIDAPEALRGYEDRIIFMPYVDWRHLPSEIRGCHISLSPLEDTLFNRAKSEIKWAEPALVGVPVIASNVGAFARCIENMSTGILVKNTEQAWYDALSSLVEDKLLREDIGRNAHKYVMKNYRTTGKRALLLKKFISDITPRVIAFGGVSFGAISGGNMVAKKHMDILQKAGNIVYGVESMVYHEKDKWQSVNEADDEIYDIFRINSKRAKDKINLKMSFDVYVATFWASVEMVDSYRYMNNDSKKLYLVQNMEADFYSNNDSIRRKVLATYSNHRLEPITISKWCQAWLEKDFNRLAKYAPNGIDIEKFTFTKRDWSKRKIKILIEGDNSSEYKRVDESFEIANQLDRNKFEASYMSYNAPPKSWYKVDNIYLKIPYSRVSDIYSNHDILIKSSVLESFSYPPLEMMATGGVAVLVKNDGNVEYINDGGNAVYYESGNIEGAKKIIEDLSANRELFNNLAASGRVTAESRSWDREKEKIVSLYE